MILNRDFSTALTFGGGFEYVAPQQPGNSAPTGSPVVVGVAQIGLTLTMDNSSIADLDGLGPFSYQWKRNGVNVSGRTGTTYVVGFADNGAAISYSINYVDGEGGPESLTSNSTASVVAQPLIENVNNPMPANIVLTSAEPYDLSQHVINPSQVPLIYTVANGSTPLNTGVSLNSSTGELSLTGAVYQVVTDVLINVAPV